MDTIFCRLEQARGPRRGAALTLHSPHPVRTGAAQAQLPLAEGPGVLPLGRRARAAPALPSPRPRARLALLPPPHTNTTHNTHICTHRSFEFPFAFATPRGLPGSMTIDTMDAKGHVQYKVKARLAQVGAAGVLGPVVRQGAA